MTTVHLVGSINLSDNDSVFRAVATEIGDGALRIPDGEVGRPYVVWFMPKIAGHPAINVESGGAMGGVVPRLTIRKDFDGPIVFDELGIGQAAIASYQKFTQLKREGAVPAKSRFQFGIPTALTMAAVLAEAGPDQERLHGAIAEVLARELGIALEAIPHEDLAIELEMPGEVGVMEGVFPTWFGVDLPRIVDYVRAFATQVPVDVDFGVHLCYGDPPPEEGARGQHWADPDDMGVLVSMANAIISGAGRPLQFIHMPVPMHRTQAPFFAPLGELRLPAETQLYLGLVHDRDGLEGAELRMAAARRYIDGFGVATECGMGRIPAETIPGLLRLHREVAELAG